MTRQVSVSVVTPAYNAAGTIEDTLKSVLAQTFPHWEQIVVDDGSTDATGAIVTGFAQRDARIRLISQPNRGESAARNAGLGVARHEWLLFLDADDWISPSYLERLTRELAANPELDAVYCQAFKVTTDGTLVPDDYGPSSPDMFQILARHVAFPVHACVVRKPLVDLVGGFDTSLRKCPDWDLWQRIARTGARFGVVPERLAFYRMRPGSASLDAFQMLRDGLRVLKQGHAPDPRVPNPHPAYVNGLTTDTVQSQEFYLASWCAGELIGQGRDARPLLEAVGDDAYPELSPAGIAEAIFEAGTLPLCQPPRAWAELWPRVRHHVEEFLIALETQARAPGLARQASSRLKELILERAVSASPVSGEGPNDSEPERAIAEELSEALETELWSSCRRATQTPRQQFQDVCSDAGVALVFQEDPCPLLGALDGIREPTLDGHTVTRWLVDAVRLATGEDECSWAQLWPLLTPRIEQFLSGLEDRAQAVGLANETLHLLERLVENKWWLRVTEGNAAHLTFPADTPEIVRIRITKATTNTSYDIQLNQPRLTVKAHTRYAISALVRADAPRHIFVGIARGKAPWTNLGFYNRLDLTSEWTRYEQEFVATDDADDARVHFDVGGGDIAVEVSSAELHDLSDRSRRDARSPNAVASGAVRSADAHPGHRFEAPAEDRRARASSGHRAIILMYHRVAEGVSDPWSLCVTPERFAQQLAVIRKHTQPMRLHELVSALERGHIPPGTVVLTFDDGYADNLHQAKPLLERYDVPTTLFVTAGYITGVREFWWDELERLLLQPGRLPVSLELNVHGTPHRWELEDSVDYSRERWLKDRSWRASEGAPSGRHALYLSLWRLLRPLRDDQRRRELLDDLRTWAGEVRTVRPTHRVLTPEELQVLRAGGLVEIGGHTMTHPVLPESPLAVQRDEVQSCKARLEQIVGAPVTSFAYPYGAFNVDTIPIVRDAGFTCACCTIERAVNGTAHPFRLPRFSVEDWDGAEFSRRLRTWFS